MAEKRGKSVKLEAKEIKSKPKTQKSTKEAKSGAKADNRKKPSPRSKDRGIGSEFAYALDQSMNSYEKEEGYLGVADKVLDPKEYVNKNVMYKKKK